MIKEYKGQINVIRKQHFDKDALTKFGPNLGYIYICDFVDHPYFRGLNSLGGHTSLVVKERKTTQGIEVETLNSIYTIGYTKKKVRRKSV